MSGLWRLSPTRRWFVIVVAIALMATSATACVRLLARPHRPWAFSGPWPDQSRPGPILLVPGYGDRKAALQNLADLIEATGRVASVVTLPAGGTGDLTEQARALDAAVAAALRGGAASVDLVGYSAGGVVVRLWLDNFAGADRARRVVTLGSPLHGTALAALAAVFFAGPNCPTACKQLAPFSDLIRDLNDSPLPAKLPWLSIWSNNDTTVMPPDSARLPGAVNVSAQSICPREVISHSHLPTDPLVVGMVIAALTGPPWTAPPTPAQCTALRAAGTDSR
jgi:triacylglycerol esterase/lipase EstA (alpha/beta hydrolase family)